MKLHWGPISPFVRKVMIAAHETGLADRITLVRSLVAMNASNPAVMRDNPLSKIPTLVTDEGFALFDSDVICEYFDTLHNGRKLVPSSGEARWQVLRWNAMGSGMLDALVLWRNERMRPEPHRSVETLKTYELKIAASLDWTEREMSLLESTDFGLGHIAIGCMFGYMDIRFADIDWRAGRSASAAWYQRFLQRPAVQVTDPAIADAAGPPVNASADPPARTP
jgi:glutathione S-transferase